MWNPLAISVPFLSSPKARSFKSEISIISLTVSLHSSIPKAKLLLSLNQHFILIQAKEGKLFKFSYKSTWTTSPTGNQEQNWDLLLQSLLGITFFFKDHISIDELCIWVHLMPGMGKGHVTAWILLICAVHRHCLLNTLMPLLDLCTLTISLAHQATPVRPRESHCTSCSAYTCTLSKLPQITNVCENIEAFKHLSPSQNIGNGNKLLVHMAHNSLLLVEKT